MEYEEFVNNKIVTAPRSGFDTDAAKLHPSLFPHQHDIVQWAASGGRRAIFASFGLGKTRMQLELMRQTKASLGDTPSRLLIICPLGVRHEFTQEAAAMDMSLKYVRTTEEVEACDTPYMVTNYERVRDGGIDVNLFVFASLDEASVLRSYGSKTYQTFLDLFRQVPYRYVCTATPSPNRFKELIHYAGFLGVMDTGQALTRFFKRDSTKANNLTLYEHKEREFWIWVSTWAIFITKPSDLGYDDTGYDLPALTVRHHRVMIQDSDVHSDPDGQTKLLRDAAVSLSVASREKRTTIDARVEKALEIIDAHPNDHFLVWHHLEREREALEDLKIDGLRTVYGSQDLEEREDLLIDFSNGKYRILATKPEIAGSGCNFQRHCHRNIFLGINYQFNDFIQAVHRTHRFQQAHPVTVDVIHTDSEDEIIKALDTKWAQHRELVGQMTDIIRTYGLNNLDAINELKRATSVERQEWNGKYATAINNDCVLETANMEEGSVDMILTSIPFSNHYEYTPSYLDFGHTTDNGHFWKQMDYLTPNLFKILKPGRVYACHVKDRILFGNATGKGAPTVSPFHAEALFHGIKHGFDYMGMVTVVTDVVAENNQTYRLGWTEQCKDGTKMGVGSPEYILLFRKPQSDRSKGYADMPVTKDKKRYGRDRWQIDAHAFWRSSGNRFIRPEEMLSMDMDKLRARYVEWSLSCVHDHDEHVALNTTMDEKGRLPATFMLFAPPSHSEDVWTDVVRMRTLNADQARNRQEAHVCPLQFDIVERLINRYTNEGELVFDPFHGLGTVSYCAIKMGRRGMGTELNADYWRNSVSYLRAAEMERDVPTLFDALQPETTAAE